VLLGAAAWGSTGTAAHFAPAAAAATSIGAARIVLGGAILLAMAAGRGHRAELRALLAVGGSARLSLALAVIAVGGYQLCFFAAVKLTGVAVGTVLAIGSAPVFTGMISRLTGGPALVHADAYRLGGAAEIDDLDLDSSTASSVTVVEWGEGLAEGLSEDRLEIAIELHGEGRVVRLTPIGPRWAADRPPGPGSLP